MFATARFQAVASVQQSKELTASRRPAIVISSSGMATGGRVLHHLAAALPHARNTVLFVGYQAAGTRGRRAGRGRAEVRIHGEMVPARRASRRSIRCLRTPTAARSCAGCGPRRRRPDGSVSCTVSRSRWTRSRRCVQNASRLERVIPRATARRYRCDARNAGICSSVSTTWPWCSCMPTASRRCRWPTRFSPGICTWPRLPGATSTTTSATRTTCEMRAPLEAVLTHGERRRRGGARRDPALHEAVLDQHRSVQQPHRAQVRAAAASRTSCSPRSARRRAERRAVAAAAGRNASSS